MFRVDRENCVDLPAEVSHYFVFSLFSFFLTVFVALSLAVGTAGLNLYARCSLMLLRIHGAFAAFILLLAWVSIATIVLLIGAEIDSAPNERRGRQT